MGGRLGFGIVGFVLWYGRTVGRLWKGRVGIYKRVGLIFSPCYCQLVPSVEV